MKTLLVLTTHFIDENIISEFRKMKNTPNVDAVLAIDNTNCKFDFENRVEDKIFFDTSCKCFFFDSNLHDEMKLPQFIEGDKKNFQKTMYENGDFRFYYFRKNFPDYDYYWQIDYDVFCNAESYENFLKRFADNSADLLIQALEKRGRADNGYYRNIVWIYNDAEIYSGLFAVVRLSAKAIDFLYKRRLEQTELFVNSTFPSKNLPFCEIFVPTELVNGGFICENLNEPRVKFFPHIYLNDERIFLKPDNHLYHPIKSVSAEISKLKSLYANLFYYYRKNFLIQLSEKLTSNENFKDLPIKFNESFTSMTVDLSYGEGVRCDTWFLNEKLYGAIDKIYTAVIFEGEYQKYFALMEQYIDITKMPSFQILYNDTCKMLAYIAPYDNVAAAANVMQIMIKMTFTILQEKINENN